MQLHCVDNDPRLIVIRINWLIHALIFSDCSSLWQRNLPAITSISLNACQTITDSLLMFWWFGFEAEQSVLMCDLEPFVWLSPAHRAIVVINPEQQVSFSDAEVNRKPHFGVRLVQARGPASKCGISCPNCIRSFPTAPLLSRVRGSR